ATTDVEHCICDICLCRQQVCAGDIRGEDEVHCLSPVAEDDRRFAGLDALHPSDEHLGVEPMDVHPRPVYVEVAQREIVQAIHPVKTAEHAFVEDLGCPIERVVSPRGVQLRRRELCRKSVDGCRGRCDHLAHPC